MTKEKIISDYLETLTFQERRCYASCCLFCNTYEVNKIENYSDCPLFKRKKEIANHIDEL